MSNKRKAADVLLGQARLPENRLTVYLRGDLVSQIADLDRRIAESPPRVKLSDPAVDPTLIKQAEGLRAEMEASAVVLTFRALPRKVWSDLMADHAADDPKKDFNPYTFFPALVQATCIDPEFDTADQVDEFYQQISEAQRDEISSTAWAVNMGQVRVPFSPNGSRPTPT